MKVCMFHPRMARTLADAVRAQLPVHDFVVVEDTSHDPAAAMDAEVLVANRFPDGMLARMPRLRWLQLTGVGTEHVAAGAPGASVVVTHAGSVPARAVAEFAWMALLGLAKDAPALVRQQREHVWRLPDARRVYGTKLVVVGTGRIGTAIATRAVGFEVDVVGVNRDGRATEGFARVIPVAALDDALREADHVVVAVPHLPSTVGLLDARRLALLPPHAAVINVSRADVVHGDAIVDALRARRLRGALLDVHACEPLPVDSPMWDVPGLWVTPHAAWVFPEEPAELATLIVENLRRYTQGAPLRNAMER